MAKNKQTKQNKGPKDILYRSVMAILAACVPIAAYFCEYIYLVVESDIFKWLAQLAGNTEDTGATEATLSIQGFVQDILPLMQGNGDAASSMWQTLEVIHTPLICVAVFFALAVLLAVVIFFFSVFSRKKTVPLCIAIGGVLSMIALYISFNAAATPLLDGTISLSDFFSNSIIVSLLAGLNAFSVIRLTTGYFVMLFLFMAMALWAGANKLIELGDKPAKPAKK
ncbi:MAG: hypothetical protein ACI4K9_04555 [Candidatus Fimenecus sp.]